MENNNINEKNLNDSNTLFDLIQNIQSKLNDEKKENIQENINEKNTQQDKNFKNETSNNIDFTSIISLLSNNSSNSNNSNNSYNCNTSQDFNFDVGTILKLQKLFSSLNTNDPKRNLLLSLKPFLRKSRQEKINEYITMLTIGSAFGIFNNRGDKQNE